MCQGRYFSVVLPLGLLNVAVLLNQEVEFGLNLGVVDKKGTFFMILDLAIGAMIAVAFLAIPFVIAVLFWESCRSLEETLFARLNHLDAV